MKKTYLVLSLAVLVLALTSFSVNAEFWGCFSNGEVVNFCNPAIPDRTCDDDLCKFCMSKFNESQGCYSPGNFNVCNGLANGDCSNIGNATIDSEPPVITISSPTQNGLYTSQSVFLGVQVNELSSLSYYDIRDDRRLSRICNECMGNSNERRFNEGVNNITIIAIDVVGNRAEKNVSFFVDSKLPKITGAEPKKGFANGDFIVEINELNPKELFLNYGNSDTGFRNKKLNLNDCVPVSRGFECSTNVDLNDYNLEMIQYSFNLTDIVGNSATYKTQFLNVDVSDPVINSLNYTVEGSKVYFVMNITEQNLEEVGYIDLSDPKAREKKLCSKLNGDICEAKANFKDGDHELSVYVIDEAGNSVAQSIEFFTDSKKPKIKKTEPRSGFANGDFYVEFSEENPVDLFLNYGNFDTGFRNKKLNINDSCLLNSKGYTCDTSVDLNDYDGEEIEYWFNLTDKAGSSAESKHIDLDVDITFPLINDLNVSIDNGDDVRFKINITEINFDRIVYVDSFDVSGREKVLCTRLVNNEMCDVTRGFSPGNHSLTLSIKDKAGNVVGQNIQFFI